MRHEEITEKIIGIFYKVHRGLGYGFLEKVYENAMIVEFEEAGLKFENQCPICVRYRGKIVGSYIADFVVEGKIVVEVKALRELSVADEWQLLNYLRSTDNSVGLLFNYGRKAEFKRKIYDKIRKY